MTSSVLGTGSQIAGYQTVYEHNFTFATVKGAGHMVPQYQPQRALDLFSRWIGVADAPALPTATTSTREVEEEPASNMLPAASVSALPSSSSSSPPKRNPIGSSRGADKVDSLPGWAGPLPSAQYSGYLDVPLKTGGEKNIHIHYWLSESENDPSTDPVVFWMNGGPGGSSLIGGLTENGAYMRRVCVCACVCLICLASMQWIYIYIYISCFASAMLERLCTHLQRCNRCETNAALSHLSRRSQDHSTWMTHRS